MCSETNIKMFSLVLFKIAKKKKLGITLITIDKRIDKYTVEFSNNRILYSNKNECLTQQHGLSL